MLPYLNSRLCINCLSHLPSSRARHFVTTDGRLGCPPIP